MNWAAVALTSGAAADCCGRLPLQRGARSKLSKIAGSSGCCRSPGASSSISPLPTSQGQEWLSRCSWAPRALPLRQACSARRLHRRLAFASGFAVAKLRTEWVRAPVLVLALDDLAPEQLPYRVRVSLPAKDAANAKIGEAVRLQATLQPPPEPIEGGFDFARQAWFSRVGATGYATSAIAPFVAAPRPPCDLQAWALIDGLRALVNARVRAVLPGGRGEIVAALITGERGGIPEEVNQAMRDSGLAHILSISGLHMVIMAGTVFWLVRAILALVPGLALRYPIKKWAAAALGAGSFISHCQAPRCRRCVPGS
jgi:competence protein